MDMFGWIGCVCLLFLCIVLLFKYLSLKKNIRQFTKELNEYQKEDYQASLKVSDGDTDLLNLATKLNEMMELNRSAKVEYEKQKKNLDIAISGISHDFRTPLTASLGYLQMVEKSGEMSEQNKEYLRIIKEKNTYLKELSDDFFELTKLENGKNEIAMNSVNLSNLLVEKLLQQHDWIEERKITTDFQIEDGLVITTDEHLLSRILDNLLSNAEKYAVDFMTVSLKKEDEGLTLIVGNKVLDVNTVNVSKVFEPFYRMEERNVPGSGLGLYVVKICCDRLDYKVSARLSGDHVFIVEVSLAYDVLVGAD